MHKCTGTPKNCTNTKIKDGCNANNECIPVGTIVENSYCSDDFTIKKIKGPKEPCTNNYECETNICSENICKNKGFFKSLIDWFKSIF